MIANRISKFVSKNNELKRNRSIRLIQSPVWVHCHLILKDDLSLEELGYQTIDAIEKVIKDDKQIQNLVVAVDITFQTGSMSTKFAVQRAQAILSKLDQNYPKLRDRFVGISDDETCLPLHGLMRTGKLDWEEIDNQHLFVFE